MTAPFAAVSPVRSAFIGQARGAAALAVTLFHSFGAESGQPIWAPLEPVRAVADFGWLGVHVFFVLSGYCMAEKISSLAAAGRGAGPFLRDRAWRIFPAYWAALLLAIGLGLASAPFNSAGLAGAVPASLGAGLAEFFLVHPYFSATGILLVGWTLVCETGFYVVTALLLAGWRAGLGLGGVLLAGSTLFVASRFVPAGEAWLVPRLWPEFWLGFLAFGGVTGPFRRPCRIALVLIGALLTIGPGLVLSPIHGAAWATSAAIVLLHRWDSAIGSLPAIRWLGPVGVWSYSLYLIHAPILSRLHNLAIRYAPAESALYAVQWLVSLAIAIGAGWLFYRAVEAPLERWRHRLNRPTTGVP